MEAGKYGLWFNGDGFREISEGDVVEDSGLIKIGGIEAYKFLKDWKKCSWILHRSWKSWKEADSIINCKCGRSYKVVLGKGICRLCRY